MENSVEDQSLAEEVLSLLDQIDIHSPSRKSYHRSTNSKQNDVKYVTPNSKKEKSEKVTGYRYLAELLKKQPYDVMCEILESNSRFEAYLTATTLEIDWILIIVDIIKRLCSVDFVSNKCELLTRICRSQLLRTISNHLGDMAVETNIKLLKKQKPFIENLVEFFMTVVQLLPSLAIEMELKKMIKKTDLVIENLNAYGNLGVTETCIERLNNATAKLEDFTVVLEKTSGVNKSSAKYERPPPGDFRDLDLYPTAEELKQKTFSFLRENKVRGSYDNVEHYLDVQFRLLREDFIDPLRSGVRKYIEAYSETGARPKHKYESIRLYRTTKFETYQTAKKNNQIGIVLNFDLHSKLRVNWEYSKRLMFGSLLLFTNDNFQTFFYATVLQRDLDQLRKGRILVSLSDNIKVDENFFKVEYLMAESEVFFEPYYRVMKTLKALEEEKFPMAKYIVYGQTETSMPAYISKFREWNIFGYDLVPGEIDYWPTAAELKLDPSQYQAFKTALTSDFSVIHGPPGTGKTFLGSKIVEVLLTNRILNQNVLSTPILVVCYTNHALDQFLEKILEYTHNIVRAGSQSKSEILKRYNLRGEQQFAVRREARHVHKNIMVWRRAIEQNEGAIKIWTIVKEKVEIPEGVLSYGLISEVLSPIEKKFIRSDEDLWNWLVPVREQDYSDESSDKEQAVHLELSSDRKDSAEGVNAEFIDVDEYVEEDENDSGLLEESMEDFETRTIVPDKCYFKTLESIACEYETTVALYKKLNTTIKKEKKKDRKKFLNMKYELGDKIRILKSEFQKLKRELSNPKYDPNDKIFLTIAKINIFELSHQQRWNLYWHWVTRLREFVISQMNKAENEYRTKLAQFEELKQMEDLFVVQRTDVVGMTTTCAARLHGLLGALKPKIVVIEEAAEVLESHIVTSLTNACEHVILIGDHKQLKPSAAVYTLCKRFNLDVSLFERMINNGMYCPTLNLQHRMRPEISKLITPLIYPDLKDHESVLLYEPVKGMSKNIFFLQHNEYEQEVDDTSSRKNPFEADFVLKLCIYLVQQGYSQEQITILTTYTGQMFAIREKKKSNYLVNRVRCVVVDKYQGEENDIILLSLVRSNKEAKIGFLKTENRVCVALSRAKRGLYIIGNADNLCESSPMWTEIKRILQKQNAIGTKLSLYCEKHAKETLVSKEKDFIKVQEGGCDNLCGELLICGHNCRSLCHSYDRKHEIYTCREKCSRMCTRLHSCLQLCFEKCRDCTVLVDRLLRCGHSVSLPCYVDDMEYKCLVVVEEVSPNCGHKILRKCHQKWEEVKCPVPCDARLDCGHVCVENCHVLTDPDHLEIKCRKPCDKPNKNCSVSTHLCQKLCFEQCGKCTVMKKFTLTCGHKLQLECSTDFSHFVCTQKCEKMCPTCELPCLKMCSENCDPCLNTVSKTIPECGHEIMVLCGVPASRDNCRKSCEFILTCGHKCPGKCYEPCISIKCNELIKDHSTESLCGHNFINRPCYEIRNRMPIRKGYLMQFCDVPCRETLKCTHLCSGTCGECWQGRLHKNCQNKCGNILICGHQCKYPCRAVCPPCQEKCNIRCRHSYCPRKCGVPCVPCQEDCEWECRHFKCTRKCYEFCNRDPCYEQCSKRIEKCGHPCIGFCGEPCPPYCRFCNPEFIEDIFFGDEDEPDARFVLLEDCNHVFESQGLDKYFRITSEEANNQSNEILMKMCPRCKTPITTTLRYMNQIRKTFDDILRVKEKIFGAQDTVMSQRADLCAALSRLTSFPNFENQPLLMDFRSQLLQKLPLTVGKKRNTSRGNTEIYSLCVIAENFINLTTFLMNLKSPITKNDLQDELNIKIKRLFKAFNEKSKNMKEEEVVFFDSEVRRIQRYAHFYTIQCSEQFASVISTKETIYDSVLEKMTVYPYSAIVDTQVVSFLEQLSEIKCSIEEKKSILQAMARELGGGIQQGHWYNCPCGYIYSVANCGMFNQVSSCPTCKRIIGTGSQNSYINYNFWNSV